MAEPTVFEMEIEGVVHPIEDKTARQEIQSLKVYATAEQDTGKTWIDGKKIYRRVFQAQNTLTEAGQITIPQDYIETPVQINGFTNVKPSYPWTPAQRMLPFAYYGTLDYCLGISVLGQSTASTANSILLQLGPGIVNETESFTITIEYTKRS